MTRTVHGLLLAAASTLAVSGGAHAQGVEISISCGAVGLELTLCQEGANAWAEETGNTVQVVSTPNSSTDRLALYQQILSAQGGDIDVYQIDVIWPGILGSHFVDLAPHIEQETIDQHFDAIIQNNTIDGELKAMPWFTDAGILYYRSDLLEEYGLEVPETWAELTNAAQTIMEGEREGGNDRFWGYVWQGRAYEGLTCNALEWIDSFGGGTIVADDGSITVNNPAAVAAVDLAASWVGTISPTGVLNYDEEGARGVFQSGNAAFMRNWPYAWALAQSDDSPVKGKVGVAVLPRGEAEGGKHTGTLGGWQLAVSNYSDNQEEAIDLVRYLTSYEEQKRRAIEGSYNPTIEALYEDEEVLEAVPFFGSLKDTFVNAVARPSRIAGDRYNEVSSAFWNAVHSTLSGSGDAAANLDALETELIRLSRGGRW
ncbi:ABC transporter substrate-binding protein [Inquilinus sp. CAU 1745]|uniref:ABC transporter substrate-binding protein n=1 Tax=Inquilinus sp. CAU 1745 TaxID=3140369 RepID=UPI00325B9E88